MTIYSNIALLLNYPSGNYTNVLAGISTDVEKYGIENVEAFKKVSAHFLTQTLQELQEYYIRTFDVNATCYLDIGYVLFGEESKRGQFLLHMKNEQLKANNDCGTEFADHLPNILTLLPILKDVLFREELIVSILIPALEHMLKNFRTDENVYKNLLQVLLNILKTDFSDSEFQQYVIPGKDKDCAGSHTCGINYSTYNKQSLNV